MLVAELNGLLAREERLSVIRGPVEFEQQLDDYRNEENRAEDADLGNEVGTSMEDLAHRQLSSGNGVRNLSQPRAAADMRPFKLIQWDNELRRANDARLKRAPYEVAPPAQPRRSTKNEELCQRDKIPSSPAQIDVVTGFRASCKLGKELSERQRLIFNHRGQQRANSSVKKHSQSFASTIWTSGE